MIRTLDAFREEIVTNDFQKEWQSLATPAYALLEYGEEVSRLLDLIIRYQLWYGDLSVYYDCDRCGKQSGTEGWGGVGEERWCSLRCVREKE